jgi:hypothetical protein
VVGSGAVEFQQELQGPVRLSQRFRVVSRPTGSWPETSLEEMTNDLPEADLGTTSGASFHVNRCSTADQPHADRTSQPDERWLPENRNPEESEPGVESSRRKHGPVP